MHLSGCRLLFLLAGLPWLGAIAPRQAQSQTAIYSGTVTSAGKPLGGASVSIREIGAGVVTGADGRYTMPVDAMRYGGRSLLIIARRIGYKPDSQRVKIAAPGAVTDFALAQDLLSLDPVIVTGVADETSLKKTPFAVAVIDGSQIRESPGLSPLASLGGKIAGASVTIGSGSPGSEPAIRLRAATSLTGRQDPLILVDGTITRLGLADINSEDIERVEVIKGAAASSLYGSDAANGVIQIFTKRGANLADGETSLRFRSEYGQNTLPRKVSLNTSTAYVLDPGTPGGFKLDAAGNRISKADDISDKTLPQIFDALNAVFRPGESVSGYLEAGYRKGPTNLHLSAQSVRETGVLALLKGYTRQNFRLNVDQQLSGKLKLFAGTFFSRSRADQTDEGTLFGSVRRLEPSIDITARNENGTPYNARISPPVTTNPLYQLANQRVRTERDRTTSSVRLSYRPLDWLTAEGNVNYDVSASNFKSFTPIGFLAPTGVPGVGSLTQTLTDSRSMNAGFLLTTVRTLSAGIINTTRLAAVEETQSANTLAVASGKLVISGVTEFGVSDPSQPAIPTSNTISIRNRNVFAVTTFDIKDRYVLDGLVRRDASSLFGEQYRSATYGRASLAWRFSEDVRLPGINDGKIRASFGTAGLRPPFDAQFETYRVVAGSPSKFTRGNPTLRPARSAETEVGVNLQFLRHYSFEYSFSEKTTRDQIMLVPVSGTTGFQNQWLNAATLAGTTHEFALGTALAPSDDLLWRLSITADRTRSRINHLAVAPFLDGPRQLRAFRVAAGEPFGVIYGTTWIRSRPQLEASIASTMLAGVASDYVLNELGYYVAKAALGKPTERPLVAYDSTGNSLFSLGNVNPDFNAGLVSSLQWRGATLSGVLTWQRGGQIYNATRQHQYEPLRDDDYDQRNVPQAAKKPQAFFQTFYSGYGINSKFVEPGGYVRLRELALNFPVPRALVRRLPNGSAADVRVGIVARNLWTSTKYSGYDPDVAVPGTGNPFGYRIDYLGYPAYRTFAFTLELGF